MPRPSWLRILWVMGVLSLPSFATGASVNIEIPRHYPGEIVDYCLSRHDLDSSRVLTCLRREESRRVSLQQTLRRHFPDPAYRHEVYSICVEQRWLKGMRQVSQCVDTLAEEAERALESLAVVEREIHSPSKREELIDLCFGHWDGSPGALAQYQTRQILHCVKTRSRYFRLLGRF